MANKKQDPYLADAENPEWSEAEFSKARPASEVLREVFSADTAEDMLAKKPGRVLGSGVKQSQTVRLDRDILAAFKATGKGWQTRMNHALREWLKEHPFKQA